MQTFIQVQQQATATEIQSLCEFAASTDPQYFEKNIISLNVEERLVLQPKPLDQSHIKRAEVQSIESILSLPSFRHRRLTAGLHLTSIVVSLATTAWIPEKLAKDDVLILCGEVSDGTKTRFGPYIHRSSRNFRMPGYNTWNAKPSLLLVGVTLLEVFHGQMLEKQPLWNDLLADVQPNDVTMACSAFLWLNQCQESMTEFIGKELGGVFYEAIRKCVCFDIGSDDDFGDAEVVVVVYREIVTPLKRCFPQFG
ncbi:hypothetical protein C8034_v002318 [Colletotrichum sidae]|uniref:Uncharacterized protein n=1 Tax=Colletotrichum sidae TaxID=1347389 RepID=A0A4R8TCZ2_9PEZI|nr:hypothetical protein C8034_v002318 [Colletotrichum sidae]